MTFAADHMMKHNGLITALVIMVALQLVLSCSVARHEYKYLVNPRAHHSDPNQFYVNIRSPDMSGDHADIIAIVNIGDGTIAAATEPEVHTFAPIITMSSLWQNHTWSLVNVTDTLIVQTRVPIEDMDTRTSWGQPTREISTFIGVLPGLNNVKNIGVFYSSRYQRIYVWYSTDNGDRIAMALLGDVGIVGTAAITIATPTFMFVNDYTMFNGPNRMYDNDGLYYMYFGAWGAAACTDHLYLRINDTMVGNQPRAAGMMDGSYPDNRVGTHGGWFVGVSNTLVIVSPFNGGASISIQFTQEHIDAIHSLDDTPTYIDTTAGRVVIGVTTGVAAILVMAVIYCVCRTRTGNTSKGINSTDVIVVGNTTRQGSESALSSARPVAYSQL